MIREKLSDLKTLSLFGVWVVIFLLLGLVVVEAKEQYDQISEISETEVLVEKGPVKAQASNKRLLKKRMLLFGEPAHQEEVVLTKSSQYTVKGIFLSPGGQYSTAVFEIKGYADQLLGVGDPLPKNGGKVLEILSDKVVIQANGRREAIPLTSYEQSDKVGSQTKRSRSVSSSKVSVSGEKKMKQMNSLLGDIPNRRGYQMGNFGNRGEGGPGLERLMKDIPPEYLEKIKNMQGGFVAP